MLCRLIISLALATAISSRAVSITGADWIVHFNLPDQSPSTNTMSADEYQIRDAIIGRINQLQTNQSAMLAVYSFSAMTLATGGAGPTLDALNAALNRGVKIRMALDDAISTTAANPNGISLASLAARTTNPLAMTQATNTSGIMHEKMSLFDYGPTNRRVIIASWNTTEVASTDEWNIALDAHCDALYDACSNEFAQLFAGHFHYDPTKSHAHDGTQFVLPGSWTNGWIRFSPPTNSTLGGNNPLTDITNRIWKAQQEIVFALNDCTQMSVATQLVAACNRGVIVNGVMPRSDTDPGKPSDAFYGYLTNAASYAATNVVHFWPAYAKADGSAFDAGQLALVHAKWMAVDPFGTNPWVMHGSANWSANALTDNNSNDENLMFIPHRDLARIFYSHFKRITGALQTRNDFWFGDGPRLWLTDTNSYSIERAIAVTGSWNSAGSASNTTGWLSITNSGLPVEFLRARRN